MGEQNYKQPLEQGPKKMEQLTVDDFTAIRNSTTSFDGMINIFQDFRYRKGEVKYGGLPISSIIHSLDELSSAIDDDIDGIRESLMHGKHEDNHLLLGWLQKFPADLHGIIEEIAVKKALKIGEYEKISIPELKKQLLEATSVMEFLSLLPFSIKVDENNDEKTIYLRNYITVGVKSLVEERNFDDVFLKDSLKKRIPDIFNTERDYLISLIRLENVILPQSRKIEDGFLKLEDITDRKTQRHVAEELMRKNEYIAEMDGIKSEFLTQIYDKNQSSIDIYYLSTAFNRKWKALMSLYT